MSPVSYPASHLDLAHRLLLRTSLLPRAIRRLSAQSDAIDVELKDGILAQIPAFTESRNPDVAAQLASHGSRHTAEILELLGGSPIGDFEFVREHARLRATQRFPLEALLHAYRCGHKVFARRMREAALAIRAPAAERQAFVTALADFTLEYTDTISTIASGEYVEQTRLLADVAGDQRAQLLGILLEGHDQADRRVAALLREAGYLDGRLAFCVALARSVDPAEMLNAERARRLADSLDQLVPTTLARRLIDVRENTVTIVFSAARRLSGWTKPSGSFSLRVCRALATAGNGVLIGISNDVEATAQIPSAHRRAGLALRLSDVGDRVLHFDRISLRQLMLHLGGNDLRQLLPGWVDPLLEADRKLNGALIATMRNYAQANMNALKAAERLSVHPNTVYARFARIKALTAHDPRSYSALGELLAAVDAR